MPSALVLNCAFPLLSRLIVTAVALAPSTTKVTVPVGVAVLAPWLPTGPEPDPVKQLANRHVLIVHGTDDGVCDPDLSYRLAERAKKVNPNICRFEVHSDGHGLHHHRPEVFALAADFALGTLCGRGFARPVTDALAAPPPLGLRMPLASGFGR